MDKMNRGERNGEVEFEKYQNHLLLKNKLGRLLWNLAYAIAFRPFALPFFNRWRLFVLRRFGAKIGSGSIVHASALVWAPWNLEIGQRTCVGPNTNLYNPDKIKLGNKVSISQYSYLCTASHDITKKDNPLVTAPIIVGDRAWIAADAFVGMNVTIGEGAVVGARAAVFKDVEPWTVVGGNPAKFIKKRIIEQ